MNSAESKKCPKKREIDGTEKLKKLEEQLKKQ